MNKPITLWISLCVCFLLTQSIAMAQSPTIITMTAPEYLGDLYEDTVIPMFEAEHPNIKVQFVYTEDTYFGNPLFEPAEGEEGFFERLTNYATTADVLYVSDFTLSPYAINTGFFLDLSPLVSVDDSMTEADFYPAAWTGFQWDGGMWALPYSMEVQLIVYDKNAFDDANLPYPDESWRLEDYILAAESIQTTNAQGEIELSPIIALNPMLLMHSEIGIMYDPTTFPTLPDLSNPELLNMLEVYNNYYTSYDFADFQGYSFNELPMSLSYPYQLSSGVFGDDKDWAISFLPGHRAGSRVEGFAISSGTAYPEAAYEFASFLTKNIDVFSYGASGIPARRILSLDDLDEENSFISQLAFDDEVQAILEEAYEVAISPQDLRYSDLFYSVRNQIQEDGVDAVAALESIELDIIEALEEAQAQQSVQLTVVDAELPPELTADEIILHFGLNTQGGNINDRQHLWDAAIDTFVAEHPVVGAIDLDYQIYGPNGMDEEIDCWYNGFGASFSSLTEAPEGFLALNPFMNADPDFDLNSFLPGVLEGAGVADSLYGYPLTVQPVTMWINIDKFEEANLPIPSGTWTTNDFTNALIALGEIRDDPSKPVLRTNMYTSSWLIMLFASYGGIPIDFNTDPPTYNLTDPQTIEAIQQVVGYAQEGLIDYSGIITNNSIFFGGLPEDEYIMVDIMNDSYFMSQINNSLGEDFPLRLVAYPDGVYMPVAYSVGTAHINSDSLNLQPCYDWISFLAAQPELFYGMPARPAQFEDPDLIAQQGIDVVAVYEDLTQTLTAPNIMALPNVYGGVSSITQGAWLEPNFFYYALDNTILNDADLETELLQAESNITTYRECTSGIDALTDQQVSDLWEQSEDDGRAYMRQFVDCAVTLVPDLRNQYQFYYEEND